MRIFRRPRAFISYSHEDRLRVDELAGKLRQRSVEPWFDERIYVAQKLDDNIKNLIENSDGTIVLGSAHSLQSTWCQREVQHSRACGIPVYPILIENIRSELPTWFTGKEDFITAPYKIAHWNDLELEFVIAELRRGRPLELRWTIIIILLTLLISPISMMTLFGTVVGKAGEDVRRQQEQVEELNMEIEASAAKGIGPMIWRRSGPNRRDWLREGSDVIVAWDKIEGNVVQERHFLDVIGEFAVDTITVVSAPNGSVSLLKTRRIERGAEPKILIQDEFDGSGTLISKRVRADRNLNWHDYNDIALSIFPAVLPSVPSFAYR